MANAGKEGKYAKNYNEKKKWETARGNINYMKNLAQMDS